MVYMLPTLQACPWSATAAAKAKAKAKAKRGRVMIMVEHRIPAAVLQGNVSG